MSNKFEPVVLYLNETEKEYLEKCSRKNFLSIEQFVMLCALSLETINNKNIYGD